MTTATSISRTCKATELCEQRTFCVGKAHYLLGPPVALDLPQTLLDEGLGPIVLIHQKRLQSFDVQGSPQSPIQALLHFWSENDDVYSTDLTTRAVIVRGTSFLFPSGEHTQALVWNFAGGHDWPSEGPYYLLEGRLFPIWRLYPDIQEAFVLATRPQVDPDSSFSSLQQNDELERRMIAVPSKIPSLCESDLPLDGLRISVKDNIDLKGLHTSLSSRAWRRHHPPKKVTSPLISRMMHQGAMVVGKSKLSQFGVLEYPTAEWIEEHCPWNPRGDGYLSPGGSTSGGAAAIAAYDWLDASIGTDTGSIRKPASHNGLFAFRPTTPKQPLEGIFPLADVLDAPGFLARDMRILKRVVKAALSIDEQPRSLSPEHIHVIQTVLEQVDQDDNDTDLKAAILMEKFIKDLSGHTNAEASYNGLQTMYHDDHSPDQQTLQEMYNEGNPPEPEEDLIQRIIDEQAVETIKHFQITQRMKAFIHEYQEIHDENPHLNPVISSILKNGRNIRKKKYVRARRLMKRFQKWFATKLENSIAVYQLSDTQLEHRDEYIQDPDDPDKKSPKSRARVPNSFISPLAGCPEIVIPIGQAPYLSTKSGNVEQLPIAVSIIGPPESDLALLDFAEDFLEKSGRSLSVKTGKNAFDHIETMRPAKKRTIDLWESFLVKGPELTVPEGEEESSSPPSRPSLDDRSLVVISDIEPGISDEDAMFTDDFTSEDEDTELHDSPLQAKSGSSQSLT